MNHLVISSDGNKVAVLYVGPSGAEADKAYDGAKGCRTVEHHRLQTATRKRDGDKAAQPTVIREHAEPKKPAKADK